MGGGPRTFAGGLNKWQWKRKHERLARQKDRKLLAHDRLVYEARLKAQLSHHNNTNDNNKNQNQHQSGVMMSPQEQISTLANRFMMDGAEDLWNENDGPLFDNPQTQVQVSRHNDNDDNEKNVVNSAKTPLSPPPRDFSGWSLKNGGSGHGHGVGRRYMSVFLQPRRLLLNTEVGCRISSCRFWSGNHLWQRFQNAAYATSSDAAVALQHVDDFKKGVTRFDQYDISPFSIKVLEEAGFKEMTNVQKATVPPILEGNDVFAKSMAGTGKTLAFLVPAIELVLKSFKDMEEHSKQPLTVLVICPTRELCSQIAAVAKAFLSYHSNLGVQVITGGTRLRLELKRMEAEPCQILVATPGRLLYHINCTAGFSNRLMSIKMLVLDEADRLLRLGYRRDLEMIIDSLPKQRQSLLFSTTMSERVHQLSLLVLKRGHSFLNTAGPGRLEIHEKVVQKYMIAPHEEHILFLFGILTEHFVEAPDFKVLVFCNTAAITGVVFEILSMLNMNVREVYSRKCPAYRARILGELKHEKRIVLVTTDVSARGLDYPDVTLVLQMGLPPDREQYIHRLGRTGRQGKAGQGLLLLAPWEESFLSEVSDMPLQSVQIPEVSLDTASKVVEAMRNLNPDLKVATYVSWLGYYNSIPTIGRDKTALVANANKFVQSLGLQTPPPLKLKTVKKMGLRYIPGVRIA